MGKKSTTPPAPDSNGAVQFIASLYESVEKQRVELENLRAEMDKMRQQTVPGYWDYERTAAHYGVHVNTVKKWVKNGFVKAYYPFGTKAPRLKVSELEEAQKQEYDIVGVRRRPLSIRKNTPQNTR